MSESADRMRTHPRERFSGTEHVINLDEAFSKLPGESTVRQGHMQKAIYRLGPTTTAIFAFEQDGTIEQHVFEGEAIIHVISGRMAVRTSKSDHELSSNDLLLLSPGVPHDFTALQPTNVLLTYVLGD